jgi:peptide/nickel transport system substrate-binding protein
MARMTRVLGPALLLCLIVVACGPGAPASQPGTGAAPARSSAGTPQRPLLIGFATEPTQFDRAFGGGSGVNDWATLLSGFLAFTNPDTTPSPYLAAELPDLGKGTWKLLPDGRMETTYKLRPGATWHDGRPVTARDYIFSQRVRVDPLMPVTNNEVERRVSRATAVDDHTLFLEWKEPYIWAGGISIPNFSPLPVHLIEELYETDKQAFIDSPFWRTDYVGAGPYKLQSWQQGVEMTLQAHDGFALGKPKIDTLVVKFITDANTIVANLLSGTIDIAFHSSIGFPQNQSLEQAGWPGTLEYWRGNPRYLEFQQRDWGNLQRAVLDVRVRQALVHAFDRSSVIDGLYFGKTEPLHFWLPLEDLSWTAVDRAVTKYGYDPARAEALLRDAGWTKGGDGLVRGTSGEEMHLPILNESQDTDQLEAEILLNYWKAVGVTGEVNRVTRQQQADGEFRSKYPAVSYSRRTLEYETMGWTNAGVTRPENRWQGINRSGYVNPVLDDTWTKALGTVDPKQREPLLIEALKTMTADAVVVPTHLQPRAMARRSDLVGPRDNSGNGGALVWNIWDWRWQ